MPITGLAFQLNDIVYRSIYPCAANASSHIESMSSMLIDKWSNFSFWHILPDQIRHCSHSTKTNGIFQFENDIFNLQCVEWHCGSLFILTAVGTRYTLEKVPVRHSGTLTVTLLPTDALLLFVVEL